MDPTRIPLFETAAQRLRWAEQRQGVLARNIANVSTPGFEPQDLRPFAQALKQATSVAPARTSPQHLAGLLETVPLAKERAHERSPDGNAVSLDTQLIKVADTETAQSVAATIYKRYMAMFGLALGRGS
ncbi:MAG: flagellar biosynthesis protein FlgB [Rhodospirillales bacterium]|nr:flagellar biosynthesis protein FlgB [Rhodospirillales bacterium]